MTRYFLIEVTGLFLPKLLLFIKNALFPGSALHNWLPLHRKEAPYDCDALLRSPSSPPNMHSPYLLSHKKSPRLNDAGS